MLKPETTWSECTDPLCLIRTCTPCSLTPAITSCCRRTVLCPTTNETHPCFTQRRTA